MAITRLPLPSFTLVLTSDPQSVHGYPTTIKLDSSSHTMRQTVRDHLMQTIDLRGEPDDNTQDPLNTSATRIDYGRIYLQTILEEEEEPSTPPAVDKKQATRTTKQYVLILLQSLRRKLFSARGTAPATID